MATKSTDRAEFPGIFADTPDPIQTLHTGPAYFEIALNRAELETILKGMSYAAQAMQDTADEVAETAGEEHAAQFRELHSEYKNIAHQAGRILAHQRRHNANQRRHSTDQRQARPENAPRPAIDHDTRPPAAPKPNYERIIQQLDQGTKAGILWLTILLLIFLAIAPLSPPPIQP